MNATFKPISDLIAISRNRVYALDTGELTSDFTTFCDPKNCGKSYDYEIPSTNIRIVRESKIIENKFNRVEILSEMAETKGYMLIKLTHESGEVYTTSILPHIFIRSIVLDNVLENGILEADMVIGQSGSTVNTWTPVRRNSDLITQQAKTFTKKSIEVGKTYVSITGTNSMIKRTILSKDKNGVIYKEEKQQLETVSSKKTKKKHPYIENNLVIKSSLQDLIRYFVLYNPYTETEYEFVTSTMLNKGMFGKFSEETYHKTKILFVPHSTGLDNFPYISDTLKDALRNNIGWNFSDVAVMVDDEDLNQTGGVADYNDNHISLRRTKSPKWTVNYVEKPEIEFDRLMKKRDTQFRLDVSQAKNFYKRGDYYSGYNSPFILKGTENMVNEYFDYMVNNGYLEIKQ